MPMQMQMLMLMPIAMAMAPPCIHCNRCNSFWFCRTMVKRCNWTLGLIKFWRIGPPLLVSFSLSYWSLLSKLLIWYWNIFAYLSFCLEIFNIEKIGFTRMELVVKEIEPKRQLIKVVYMLKELTLFNYIPFLIHFKRVKKKFY